MKPHEETWYAKNRTDCTTWVMLEAPHREAILAGTIQAGDPGFEIADARAQLAAQAPAMARLLLGFIVDEQGHLANECPTCGAPLGAYPVGHHERGVHAADCELAAVTNPLCCVVCKQNIAKRIRLKGRLLLNLCRNARCSRSYNAYIGGPVVSSRAGELRAEAESDESYSGEYFYGDKERDPWEAATEATYK